MFRRPLLVLFAMAAAMVMAPAANASTVTFYASGSLTGEISFSVDPIGYGSGYWGITNVSADLTVPGVVSFSVPSYGYDQNTKTYIPNQYNTQGHFGDAVFAWDNIFHEFQPGQWLDTWGVLFLVGNGQNQQEVNIWGAGSGDNYQWEDAVGGHYVRGGNFTMSQVPEPSSELLLGTGLVALAAGLFFRSTRPAGAAHP